MFNIGPGELIVILILALVLLGPEKLPEMARTVGKGMRELRRATEDIKDQVESELYKLDDTKPVVKAPEGPRYAKAAPAPQLPPAAPALASETPAEGQPAPPQESPKEPAKND
jgi:sec-independent protein translocase protein TatB